MMHTTCLYCGSKLPAVPARPVRSDRLRLVFGAPRFLVDPPTFDWEWKPSVAIPAAEATT